MRSSVIVFPGSNCDRDVSVALEKFQIKNQMVWHNETNLPKSDLVVLPGGFSYGDYLRTGCIASKSRIINDVVKHAKRGALVLGICNGFQILIESGLLPGALIVNQAVRFLSQDVTLEVATTDSIYTQSLKRGQNLTMPIAHKQGNYIADKDILKMLEDEDRVAFRYSKGKDGNPNGSMERIAGVMNKKRNVLGMMPHPERSAESVLGSEDGLKIFKSMMGIA